MATSQNSNSNNLAGGLPPLNITCTSSDCGNNLHCFRKSGRMPKNGYVGDKCIDCGISLINWEKVKERKIEDISFTFNELMKEYVRHLFWHKEVDEKAILHAKRKGKLDLYIAVRKRIQQSVAPAKPFHDGGQTPFEGNIIFYAQHATATCCRKCIEEWHGIPRGIDLSEEQVKYFSELITKYINTRLPELKDFPEKIQSQRRNENQLRLWSD
jgi:Domain of unknown function (DUF4186)